MKNLLDDFISLFFPKTCFACGNNLFTNENIVCTSCLYHLPKTDFHKDPDNPVSKVFWGRVEIISATSFLYYRKGGKVQHLIHQLKYKGHKEIGIFLGELYGTDLKKTPEYSNIETIIPIPLHRKKLKMRGFNQSEYFAIGLANSMNTNIDTASVVRTIATSTQTKKSRYKRWENVSNIFEINNPENLAGKSILLVDDVITTGSTMEACIASLNSLPGVKVSVASIAFASN
ncbi:MAG: phosphoribosyltransferase family protein [Bacteroidales bacterium]